MWSRKIVDKIQIFDNRKVVEETDIIKRIKKNKTREKEIVQALQKEDRSAWEEDEVVYIVIYKSTCPENYIPTVMPPLNPISPPSMAATFLATRLMAVLQPFGYSVFHGGGTPIQLSLP